MNLTVHPCPHCMGHHLRGNAQFCNGVDKGCTYCNRMAGNRKCKRHVAREAITLQRWRNL